MAGSRETDRSASCTLPSFGPVGPAQLVAQDPLFAVVWDRYPVSRGHCLIIPKREARLFGDLTAAEEEGLMRWIGRCLDHLKTSLDPKPDGFNVGFNDGPAAGQTVPQFHVHVIPRYTGDVADPRGGIRWALPAKANYWDRSMAGLDEGEGPAHKAT